MLEKRRLTALAAAALTRIRDQSGEQRRLNSTMVSASAMEEPPESGNRRLSCLNPGALRPSVQLPESIATS